MKRVASISQSLKVANLMAFALLTTGAARASDCKSDLAHRQTCQTVAQLPPTAPKSMTSQLAGGWQLVKTPDPRGGGQLVSIIHVTDTVRSDLNFAGFTLRCARVGIEAVLVILEPLSPGTKVPVSIRGASQTTNFEGKTIQGGEAILLPQAATTLAQSAWQSSSELTIDITTPLSPIHGVVPITGLSEAIKTLAQSCANPG